MGRRVKGLQFGRKKERKINLSVFQEMVIWIVEIAITIAIAIVFTYFFGVRSTVVGPSMSPQLEDGDEVLIDRFFYKFVSPKAGDVIAFLPNGNTNTHYYLKRVIGVPGDTVQIRGGSEDSRFANIGNIRESYIIGKAWFVLSPREKLGFIK